MSLKSSLELTIVNCAIVNNNYAVDGNNFCYPVYDESNQPVLRSGLIRQGVNNTVSEKILPISSIFKGEWLFAGDLDVHFGHQITEGISRLWLLNKIPNIRGVIFTSRSNRTTIGALNKPIYSKLFELLDSMGLDIRVMFQEAAKIECLYVPSQSIVLGDYSTFEHAQTVAMLKDSLYETQSEFKCGDFIYFSRSSFGGKRKMINELELEASLKNLGFDIVYPESLSLNDMTYIMGFAKVIIGAEGTALLNSLFARPNTTVICIGGNNARNKTQHNVCKSKNQNFKLVKQDVKDDGWYVDINYLLQEVNNAII